MKGQGHFGVQRLGVGHLWVPNLVFSRCLHSSLCAVNT